MVAIDVDERDWPVVRVRWPSVALDRAAIDAFGRRVEAAIARGGRVVVIVDARAAAPMRPRDVARVIAIDRRLARAAKDVIAARAIVVGALAVRLLAPMLAAMRPSIPTRAFDDPGDAERWARAQF